MLRGLKILPTLVYIYLGINISSTHLKRQDYFSLLHKTKQKIQGWQAKLLNLASRCTLIKVVLNSYPLYSMQTKGFLSQSLMILKYTVGSSYEIRLINLSTCLAFLGISFLNLQGLGVLISKILGDGILPLCMAKLVWRILNNPSKL